MIMIRINKWQVSMQKIRKLLERCSLFVHYLKKLSLSSIIFIIIIILNLIRQTRHSLVICCQALQGILDTPVHIDDAALPVCSDLDIWSLTQRHSVFRGESIGPTSGCLHSTWIFNSSSYFSWAGLGGWLDTYNDTKRSNKNWQ